MLDQIRIGRKLAELRQRHALTQENIANTLYVTHQAVSRWETGRALPSIDNFVMLMALFHVSPEEILCLDQAPIIDDVEAALQEHDRSWLIHEATLRNICNLSLTDIIHRLSLEERRYALHLLLENRIPTDENLWPRLSETERIWLIREHREKGYPLEIERIRRMLSPAERKMIKEVYDENHQNVALSRKRRTR